MPSENKMGFVFCLHVKVCKLLLKGCHSLDKVLYSCPCSQYVKQCWWQVCQPILSEYYSTLKDAGNVTSPTPLDSLAWCLEEVCTQCCEHQSTTGKVHITCCTPLIGVRIIVSTLLVVVLPSPATKGLSSKTAIPKFMWGVNIERSGLQHYAMVYGHQNHLPSNEKNNVNTHKL